MTSNGRLVPAARSGGHRLSSGPQAPLGALTSANGFNADTPVFDLLVAEYRRDFRMVPGDPWGEYRLPGFRETQMNSGNGTSGRFRLPPGGPSSLAS